MSNALAIAGVTAVIKDLLDSGLIDHAVIDAMGAGVAVSAQAPDTIRSRPTPPCATQRCRRATQPATASPIRRSHSICTTC